MEEMKKHLLGYADTKADEVFATRRAARLVMTGFHNVEELSGLSTKAMENMTTNPKEQALLASMVTVMDDLQAQSRAARMRERLGLRDPKQPGPRSAEDVALGLTPEELANLHASNEELQDSLGLASRLTREVPRHCMVPGRQRWLWHQRSSKASTRKCRPFWNKRRGQFAWGHRRGASLRWQRACELGTPSLPRCCPTHLRRHSHCAARTTCPNGSAFSSTLTRPPATCHICAGAVKSSKGISHGVQCALGPY